MECPSCGSRDIEFIESSGHRVCVQCGTVLEENAIVSSVEFQECGDRSHVVGQFVSASSSKVCWWNLWLTYPTDYVRLVAHQYIAVCPQTPHHHSQNTTAVTLILTLNSLGHSLYTLHSTPNQPLILVFLSPSLASLLAHHPEDTVAMGSLVNPEMPPFLMLSALLLR